MPLRPMTKSPRFTDASIDVNWTDTKRGRSPSFDAMSAATSTSKPTTRVGIARVGLDEGRAAFGIAAPAQFTGNPAAGGRRARAAAAPTSSAAASHTIPSEKMVRRPTVMMVSMMEEPR